MNIFLNPFKWRVIFINEWTLSILEYIELFIQSRLKEIKFLFLVPDPIYDKSSVSSACGDL